MKSIILVPFFAAAVFGDTTNITTTAQPTTGDGNTVCLRVTSSEHETLCQGPDGWEPHHWPGDEITMKYNGETVATINQGFQDFEYCINSFDHANDKLQLENDGYNAVCITSLSINGEQLLVGKNNDLQSFWMSKGQICDDDFMSTEEITIQNGKVISSICVERRDYEMPDCDTPEELEKNICMIGQYMHLYNQNNNRNWNENFYIPQFMMKFEGCCRPDSLSDIFLDVFFGYCPGVPNHHASEDEEFTMFPEFHWHNNEQDGLFCGPMSTIGCDCDTTYDFKDEVLCNELMSIPRDEILEMIPHKAEHEWGIDDMLPGYFCLRERICGNIDHTDDCSHVHGLVDALLYGESDDHEECNR